MLMISNGTKLTQCQDLNPGLPTSITHAHNSSSEVSLEDSDVTHPGNLAEVLLSY